MECQREFGHFFSTFHEGNSLMGKIKNEKERDYNLCNSFVSFTGLNCLTSYLNFKIYLYMYLWHMVVMIGGHRKA